jgi:ABC-type molybdenum transport system ATPase subunit/photorepair protein PhrA
MENEQILQEVITYVEETLRNSSRGSIEYIDFKNQKNRINTRQNHIIYGRRGAGKRSLLNVVEK